MARTTEEVKVKHALDGELLVVVEQSLCCLRENIPSRHGSPLCMLIFILVYSNQYIIML